jgi:hypothetical protein
MAVMSDSAPEPTCERCGKPVDPNGPGVVKAVPVVHVEMMGTTEWIDGMGVYFHDDCFPYGSSDFSLVES